MQNFNQTMALQFEDKVERYGGTNRYFFKGNGSYGWPLVAILGQNQPSSFCRNSIRIDKRHYCSIIPVFHYKKLLVYSKNHMGYV